MRGWLHRQPRATCREGFATVGHQPWLRLTPLPRLVLLRRAGHWGGRPVALRPLHVHDHVFPGQSELHLDVEDLALVRMPVGRIEHDATGSYLVAEYAEMARQFAHARLDGR